MKSKLEIATEIAKKIIAIPDNLKEHAADHKLMRVTEIVQSAMRMSEIQDRDFIGRSLNAYWHEAANNLQRKDLGDIERRQYEGQRDRAREIMLRLGVI